MTEKNKEVLPANIKQIGTIGEGKRIYMEDYAVTYIQQYAAADNAREKIAILVGQTLQIDEQEVLFVSGVIQGKYSTHKNGMVQLTEKSWQYIKKQVDLYFENLQVVGWAYIQPGFEDYVKDNIVTYQLNNLERGIEVLYLIDPLEKVSSFYVWNESEAGFNALRGYMVYYEKNEGMHEYMLENKLKLNEESFEYEDVLVNMAEKEQAEKNTAPRSLKRKTRAVAEQRRMINMLGSASFVMLLVCFIMGAGLIENDERINQLELKLANMESTVNGAQSVFASQTQQQITEPVTENVTQSTTSKPVIQEQEPVTQSINTKTATDTYKVSSGDTLSSISRAVYGTIDKIDDIMNLNGMTDPNQLIEGTELELP